MTCGQKNKVVTPAKADNAEIQWAAESVIRQDSNWVRGYSTADMARVLRLPGGLPSTSRVSAITNQKLVRLSFVESTLNNNFGGDRVAKRTRKIELFRLPP